MIRKFIVRTFILGIIACMLVGGTLFWLATHHVVRTERGCFVLKKRFLTMQESFVDTCGWTSEDYATHPDLSEAMSKQGYADLLTELKTREMKAAVRDKAGKMGASARRLKDQVTSKVEGWFGVKNEADDRASEPGDGNQTKSGTNENILPQGD